MRQDDTWPGSKDYEGLLATDQTDEDYTFLSIKDWVIFFQKEKEDLKKEWIRTYQFYCELALEKILAKTDPDAIMLEPLYDSNFSLVTLKIGRAYLSEMIQQPLAHQEIWLFLSEYMKKAISKHHHFPIKLLSYILDVMRDPLMIQSIQRYMSYPIGYRLRFHDPLAINKIFHKVKFIQNKIFQRKKNHELLGSFTQTQEQIPTLLEYIRSHILSDTKLHDRLESLAFDIDNLSKDMDLTRLSWKEKNNFLLFACRHANKRSPLSLLKRLLIAGATVQSYYDNEKNAITLLATKGYEEELDLLLSYSPHYVCKRDRDGYTSLNYAILHEHISCIRVLKKHGAFLKHRDLIHKDLLLAAKYLCIDSIKEILDPTHLYPITKEIVARFLNYLVKKDCQSHITLLPTVLIFAIQWEVSDLEDMIYLSIKNILRTPSLIQESIQKGLFGYLSIEHKKKLLFQSITAESYICFDYLIHSNYLIDIQDDEGCTPLMRLVQKKWLIGIRHVLQYSPNIEIKNHRDQSVLDIAQQLSRSKDATNQIYDMLKHHIAIRKRYDSELEEFFDEFIEDETIPYCNSNSTTIGESSMVSERVITPDVVDSDPLFWKTLEALLASPPKKDLPHSNYQELAISASECCTSMIPVEARSAIDLPNFSPILLRDNINSRAQKTEFLDPSLMDQESDHNPRKKNRFK